MPDNIPSVPSGAVPPKKETGKVQPKKETVRINLPPKPSAAPTIKMPTLPPGGPVAAGATPAAAASSVPPSHAPSRAAPAPVAASRSSPAAPPRPALGGVAAAPTVSTVDVGLAVAAAVVAFIAAVSVVLLGFTNLLTP